MYFLLTGCNAKDGFAHYIGSLAPKCFPVMVFQWHVMMLLSVTPIHKSLPILQDLYKIYC
jgi:hypothetical protein